MGLKSVQFIFVSYTFVTSLESHMGFILAKPMLPEQLNPSNFFIQLIEDKNFILCQRQSPLNVLPNQVFSVLVFSYFQLFTPSHLMKTFIQSVIFTTEDEKIRTNSLQWKAGLNSW